MRRWIALGVVVLVAVVVWQGSIRSSAGPAHGTVFSGPLLPQTRPATILRVGTFNIHGGIGRSGKRDLDLTAQALCDLDVIGLNEVHGRSLDDRRDQAAILGQKLQLTFLFAPSERRWWHEHFGNGALSRVPVDSWERIPLPCTQSRGFRNVLLLRVPLGTRIVQVIVTHIDRQRDRIPQLQAVAQRFLSLPEPAVLMGDLNSDASDPAIRQLLSAPGVVDAVGQAVPSAAPSRIDWILVRGLRCTDGGIVDNGASDHPLVWARLEAVP